MSVLLLICCLEVTKYRRIFLKKISSDLLTLYSICALALNYSLNWLVQVEKYRYVLNLRQFRVATASLRSLIKKPSLHFATAPTNLS